jgi:hypothetical protein
LKKFYWESNEHIFDCRQKLKVCKLES